jgi:hypothetical protein
MKGISVMSTTTYPPALALSPEERTELDNMMIAISAQLGQLKGLGERPGPVSLSFAQTFSRAVEGLETDLILLEAASDIAKEEQKG